VSNFQPICPPLEALYSIQIILRFMPLSGNFATWGQAYTLFIYNYHIITMTGLLPNPLRIEIYIHLRAAEDMASILACTGTSTSQIYAMKRNLVKYGILTPQEASHGARRGKSLPRKRNLYVFYRQIWKYWSYFWRIYTVGPCRIYVSKKSRRLPRQGKALDIRWWDKMVY